MVCLKGFSKFVNVLALLKIKNCSLNYLKFSKIADNIFIENLYKNFEVKKILVNKLNF